jgi:hypothetical protein
MTGPEDDPNWGPYSRGEKIVPSYQPRPKGKTPETPDNALTSEQIEEKITWIARDLIYVWPEHRKFCTLGESWDSGVNKGPSEYDLKHLRINRLLELREMILSGAIHAVEG